jgi:hypothetical protein
MMAIFGGRQAMLELPHMDQIAREIAAEARQEDFLRVLRIRFGPVPAEIGAALETISDEAKLDELVDLAVGCPDLEAFRAGIPA